MKNVRSKTCKSCNFTGKVNAEELCGNCAETMSDGKCGVCSRDVGHGDKGLHCDLCLRWVHAQCERIGDKLYKELQGEKELPWACTKCLTQAKRNAEYVRKVREEKENLLREQERMDSEVKNLRECLGAVERENRSLRERVRDLERQQVAEVRGGEVTSVEGAGAPNKEGTGERPNPQVRQDGEPEVAASQGAVGERVETETAEDRSVEAGTAPRAAAPPKRKARMPIVCVGDSMVKNANRHMAMRGEDSHLVSLSGKGIEDIAQVARERMRGLEEGMLILQGGGNGLRQLGPEQTVRKVMECVREVKKERKVRVAVVGVLGRPRETRGYEELRRETNRLLQEEVVKMKIECSRREGDFGVSFLDLDGALPPVVYGRDGVHLSREGEKKMCKRFLEWVMATEQLARMRERKEESTRE